MCLRMIRVGECLILPRFLPTLECSSRVLTSLDIFDSLNPLSLSRLLISYSRYYCRFIAQSWLEVGRSFFYFLLAVELRPLQNEMLIRIK